MKLGPFLAVILLSAGCCHLYPGNAGTMEACAGRIAESLARGLDGSCMGVNVLVSTPVESVSLAPSGFGLALQELLIGALVEEKVNIGHPFGRKGSCRLDMPKQMLGGDQNLGLAEQNFGARA